MSERIIPYEHVTGVCHIGEGAICCRYLAMDQRGYFCAKHSASLRPVIDEQVKAGVLKSKGDNCDGYPLGGIEVIPPNLESYSKLEDIKKENDKLRGLLAWGNDPCIYCGLPRDQMARCQSGFPGCARADDMVAVPDLEGWIHKPRQA